MSSQVQTSRTLFSYRLGNDVPTLDEMPLLRAFVEEWKSSQPFKDVTALLIQHQLGNQGPQMQALVELGLDPKRIHWLDIPYTSSDLFRRTMQQRHGIPKRNFWVNRCGVLDPYASYQFVRTHDAFLRFLRKPPERLLVLDDGAYFLDAAMSFRKQLPHIAVVEQTTRGIANIRRNAALARFARNYAVINVARSRPKLELESPWIGMSVLLSLAHHLRALARRSRRFAVKSDSTCLVIGYGAVGQQVAAHLRDIATVYVSDSERSRTRLAERDGFAVWDRSSQLENPDAIEFKLIVGCTGRASFEVGDHGFLDRHAVLVSASSGAVELSRSAFIDLATVSPRDDLRLTSRRMVPNRVHQNIRIQLRDRSLVFLNGGFPINFDGRLNSIPAKYMQPTAMLMVYGAIQALTTPGRGIVEVDQQFTTELNDKFRKSLNETELAALNLCSRDSVV